MYIFVDLYVQYMYYSEAVKNKKGDVRNDKG